MTPNPKTGTQDERVEAPRFTDRDGNERSATEVLEEVGCCPYHDDACRRIATLLREQARQLEEARQGFTWEDVDLLRRVSMTPGGEPNGVSDADAGGLDELADRIAKRLPPREHS